MNFDPRHLPSNGAGCGGDPARFRMPRTASAPVDLMPSPSLAGKLKARLAGPGGGLMPAWAYGTGAPMGKRAWMGVVTVLVVMLALVAVGMFTSDARAETTLTIGHIQLKKDGRYSRSRSFAQFLGQPLGRPWSGSKLALDEIKWHGAAAGVSFDLVRKKVKSKQTVADVIREMSASGISFFVLDLPADDMAKAAAALRDEPVLLFNASAQEDRLRGPACQANLLHVLPSYAMLADALGQYLKLRKWDEVLMLVGPEQADTEWAVAFNRTARRYGIDIDETRNFVLSNDPRIREENNPILLTGSADYDVVFVADSDGEFARNMNYTIKDARPLVGGEGLAPLAWHWAWERNGGPQLEKRFQDRFERPMGSRDWAAWLSVKAVAEAVQRTASADFKTLKDFLLGPELVLDGFKGNRLNFRPWNGQLRQPILLATHNWVVERAPIEGFLHKTNNMDTLGHDERDSVCQR